MLYIHILITFLILSLTNSNPSPELKFLDSLNPDQLDKALIEFDDERRTDWHFFPSTMFKREGISLKELSEKQRILAFDLLASHLSEVGYDKVRNIISLEEFLAEKENNHVMRDPEKYYLSFYGHPEEDEIWGWGFEGHHVSLNFTVVQGEVTMTPRFLGSNPGEIREGPRKGTRVLKNEEDMAFSLLNSFTDAQRGKAVFKDGTFGDIVTFVTSEVSPLDVVGIPMKDLNAIQKKNLISLIEVYLSSMPDALAAERMEKLQAENLSEIHFGWAGSAKPGKPHYYRIQGQTFIVEYDNTQNNANHIHTVWRDFDGDFGRDLLREHYKSSHH